MTQKFNEIFQADIFRYTDSPKQIKRFYEYKFLYYLRKLQVEKSRLLRSYYIRIYNGLCEKHGLEICPSTRIGKGLYIGHPYGITINSNAIIGENVNIHKGVTIGRENRGKRKGSPVIGDFVWIGVNASVVGNVKIGNDVLIAPNTFVNCDVPDHCVVFGNPCVVHCRDNATADYIQRPYVDESSINNG